jgi:hypothetical protein
MGLRRVQEPAHDVVESLGLGESLVTTLVCKNPNTGADESGCEAINGPKRNPSQRLERLRPRSGVDQRVDSFDCLVEATEKKEVPYTVPRREKKLK